MSTVVAVLTTAEADLLEQAEAVIERGIKTFIEVGEALASVRDNRLYRAEFATFEEYCRDKWGFSKSRAYQLVDAAKVVEMISSTTVEKIDISERATRELSPLLETPDEMRAAFKEALDRSDGKPTAAVIREVVRERMDPASPLAQAAERELDKVEQRAAIAEANRASSEGFTPERIAEINEFVKPAVQFGRLVSACEWFLEQIADVDFDAAARGYTADKARPITEAVARLASIRRTLEAAV